MTNLVRANACREKMKRIGLTQKQVTDGVGFNVCTIRRAMHRVNNAHVSEKRQHVIFSFIEAYACPVSITRWVNIHKLPNGVLSANPILFDSQELAEANANRWSSPYVASAPITFIVKE